MRGKLKLREIYPSATDFIKSINVSLNGGTVGDSRISDYIFCKHMEISKGDMDEMAEEDILSFSWCMRRESKVNKR